MASRTIEPRLGARHGEPLRFEDVRHAEAETILELRRRRLREPEDRAAAARHDRRAAGPRDDFVGLALSGGGIRSATFNLGVLTTLARNGLLRRLDYLSTNSGGGYIGGWLTAWIHRRGLDAVERELSGVDAVERSNPDAIAASSSAEAEAEPVASLRRNSNFLTPRAGWLTADTWEFVTSYLRNLALNLSILSLTLAAVLLGPRLVVYVSEALGRHPFLACGVALAGLAVALLALGVNIQWLDERRNGEAPWYAGLGAIQLLIVVPFFVSAWQFGILIWQAQAALDERGLAGWLAGILPSLGGLAVGTAARLEPAMWALLAGMLFSIFWVLALGLTNVDLWIRQHRAEPRSIRLWMAILATAPFAGAMGGFAIWALTSLIERFDLALTGGDHEPWHLFHVNVWLAPAVIVGFFVAAWFHTGLMGRAFPQSHRQFMSRLGAWLLIYAITWVGLFGVAVYCPTLLLWLGTVKTSAVGVLWVATTGAGAAFARRLPEVEMHSSTWKRLVLAFVPQLFIVGMLAVVALGVHIVLVPEPSSLSAPCQDFWPRSGTSFGQILDCQTQRMWAAGGPAVTGGLLVFCLAAATILSWRIDINQFSMHLFYRNRIVCAFLGASSSRRAHPFTGFDPQDDLRLEDVVGVDYDGPFPVINAALNLVAGKDLAWQERKAASFVFTPLHVGFELPVAPTRNREIPFRRDDEAPLGRAGQCVDPSYRCTASYGRRPRGDRRAAHGHESLSHAPASKPETARPETALPRSDHSGLTLGTAMSISGAAISSAMGAQTTPAMAFLLTMLNVRLGWWLGNPRHEETHWRMGPGIGLLSLVNELFGRSDERSRYVYLSDGGHFDNLALYELVRRRCRFIIVSDAGADPDSQFRDLGAAIRKCRNDLGVEIEIDTTDLRGDGDRRSGTHFALGTIRYPVAGGAMTTGHLLYLKASVTGDEPQDVLNYAAEHCKFPHESTVDQWFEESQFESYRKLGEHVADAAFMPASRGKTFQQVLRAIRQGTSPADGSPDRREATHPAARETPAARLETPASTAFGERRSP